MTVARCFFRFTRGPTPKEKGGEHYRAPQEMAFTAHLRKAQLFLAHPSQSTSWGSALAGFMHVSDQHLEPRA